MSKKGKEEEVVALLCLVVREIKTRLEVGRV